MSVWYEDWLGYDRETLNRAKYYNYEKAKKHIAKFGLRTRSDWYNFCKQGKRPSEIPFSVKDFYKDQWKGWADFLGKED